MRLSSLLRLASLVFVSAVGLAACGDDGKGNGTPIDAAPGGPDACVGLQCQQVQCPMGMTTSLSGTVYAPNGTLPLYNAIVYVPNGPVDAFIPGAQCDQCDEELSGDPVVKTTTGTDGKFQLDNVPVSPDLPLVIKIGKWRRIVHVPTVSMCQDTPLDAELTRLPKNQTEGDIPLMAMSTGGKDALECLLRKIGLDDSEFTTAGGTGRVHLYAGIGGTAQFAANLNGGQSFADTTTLWDTVDHLKQYDIVFLSCEGGSQHPENKGQTAVDNMGAYTDLGGRVFMSHWHNYWLQHGPTSWQSIAQFNFLPDIGNVTADVDTTFARGADMAQWLLNVGASTELGKIDLHAAQHTVVGVDTSQAERWIWVPDAGGNPSIQYLAFTTPLSNPVDNRCGKAVMSDIHVSTGDESGTALRFPGGCTTTGLSAQEKVLAFMIFDIAGCVGPAIP
ncbi:MAG TPA: hypothetical protein VHE35_37015 [Kofleriaceae bacterium]|nr:hypothetical protein [Kofleriaceae bacterium]